MLPPILGSDTKTKGGPLRKLKFFSDFLLWLVLFYLLGASHIKNFRPPKSFRGFPKIGCDIYTTLYDCCLSTILG